MTYFVNEMDAREAIANILRPIYGTANITIAERNKRNAATRDVIFVVEVKKDDEKCLALLNGLFKENVANPSGLEWQGTKVDFINDKEHEYVLIKAIVQNTL